MPSAASTTRASSSSKSPRGPSAASARGRCASTGPRDASATLESLLLRHAIGDRVDRWTRESGASGVMMIPIPGPGVLRGMDGADRARAVPGIDDVVLTAKIDQTLVPLPEGATYLGFIFARADSPSEVESALRTAHACLEVRMDRAIPVSSS